MNKLPIKDILAAVDMGALSIQQVKTNLLNRYVSSVKGDREKQELAVFKTNEYYNKGFFVLQKHKKLLWQLLCLSGNTGKIAYHEWIGHKKKAGDNSKAAKFLSNMFPNMKQDEVELLAKISTKAEIKQYAESLGMDKKDVKL